MKRAFFIISALVVVLISWTSCSDMNAKHDIYLSQGEQIYIGKVDSVHVFPGKERVKVRFWASDPRCKSVGFFWSPYNDSIFVDVVKTSSVDSFDVVIGGPTGLKNIAEGNYTMKVHTYDNKGHRSVPFEKIIRVYGSRYQSTLTSRVLTSRLFTASTRSLSLFLGSPINSEDIGVKVSFTTTANTQVDSVILNAGYVNPLRLANVDPSKEVSYRTMYIPSPLAIDTFLSAPRIVSLN